MSEAIADAEVKAWEECDLGLDEIRKIHFSGFISGAMWMKRNPGPATREMLETAKLIIDQETCSKDVLEDCKAFIAEWES